MSVDANTVLRAIISGRAHFAAAPSDYARGMLNGQLMAARLIGPVDMALLKEATAAVDALRKTSAGGL